MCHRAHASVSAITRFLQPAATGLLMQRELLALAQVLEHPKRPVALILGGARVSDKLGLIQNLLSRVDRLLIGGAMAFTFLEALGGEMGRSPVEPDLVVTAKQILAEAARRKVEILLPDDLVVATYPEDHTRIRQCPADRIPIAMTGLDIGPRTIARFREALRDAATVLWNGPVGMFEHPPFATGTMELAQIIAAHQGADRRGWDRHGRGSPTGRRGRQDRLPVDGGNGLPRSPRGSRAARCRRPDRGRSGQAWEGHRMTSDFKKEREEMVEAQIASRGIRDPAVLHAMRTVPRECFVAEYQQDQAYDDGPLPIGEGQTISQPYVVALMTEAVEPKPGDRALEVGTGSGYAAAVLATIVAEVYTIERLGGLAQKARQRLASLGYHNVHVLEGDGTLGWPEHAPYDAIIVTAGGPRVPAPLLEQLAIGGRLIMPVGSAHRFQHLERVTRTAIDQYEHEDLEDVAFVPLIGKEGWRDEGSAA